MSDETINVWWTFITILLSGYTIGMCVAIWIGRREDKKEGAE